MKTSNENLFILIPKELGEELECKVTFHIENNGIGPYEYWGFKGYDSGQNYIEIDSIYPNFSDQSEELKININKYINDNYDYICEDIITEIYKIFADDDGIYNLI